MFFINWNHLSVDRIITIYGIYLSLVVLFTIFAVKLIKRGDKSLRKNFIIQFFLYLAFGLFLNCIYAPIDDVLVQTFGNKTVIFFSTMGIGNLFLFIYSITKSELEFTSKNALIAEILIALAASGYFIISISFGPNYMPIWPLPFILYCTLITQALFLSSIITGLKIFKTMENKVMRKKFSAFLIGLCCIELVLIQTLLKNGQYVTSPLLLIMGLSIIPGGLFIYYGVGKDLEEKK